MRIELNRIQEPFHFQARNENGHVVDIDASPSIGGQDAGSRPMELLLMGLAGCSAIDVVNILNKQKQPIHDLKVVVEAVRVYELPSIFEKIDVQFQLSGDLDQNKVARALELTQEKYCSVSRILEATAEVTFSYKILDHEQEKV